MANIKEINNRLRESAIRSGICQQWRREWQQEWTEQQLVQRFFKGIDFFIETRFISPNDINALFPKDFLRRNAIIVDDHFSLLNPRQDDGTRYAAIIGESTANIRINGRNMASIYACDNAKLKIIAHNSSWLMIHLYDKAAAEIQNTETTTITVITHSANNTVTSSSPIILKTTIPQLP